jgi:hypothetical protein
VKSKRLRKVERWPRRRHSSHDRVAGWVLVIVTLALVVRALYAFAR